MKNLKWIATCLAVLFLVCHAHAAENFVARFAGQQAVDGVNSIAVTFSETLDAAQNIDTYLALFTEDDVAQDGSWVLSKDPQVVYFSNVEPNTGYVIKIYKGLKAASGKQLETAQKFTVKTRDVVPMISFGSKGFILPSKLNRGLPVNALNIDRADIDFFRVKPDFINEFASNFTHSDEIFYYMNKELHSYADLVYSGRWDLKINKDLRTEVNLPITHIKELSTPGIYFAVLKGAGHYSYGYSSTWFSISDLGLHVKHYKNMLQCHVQSLQTAKPVKGVHVEGYDKKGKKIFDITTDKTGVAAISTATQNLTHLLARSGKSITFLPMNAPALDLSEFRGAIEPFRPIDLFVYGPRDLYRPGETIVVDGLLRNQDGRMTAALPLTASIIRPDGRVVHEFIWKGSNFNHYHYTWSLPRDALTGKWRMTFKHAADTLKEYRFTVADFLPERMKLMVTNPPGQDDILDVSDSPAMRLQADFLYGAPAAGIQSDAMIHVRPARKLFKKKWPGYQFGDSTDNFKRSFDTDTIVLDKNGSGTLKVENEWEKALSPLWLTANASVYDSGGRPVVRNKSWQIWPSDALVGIRLLGKDDTVESDSLAQFDVIAVNKQGERISEEGLKVTVIKEHREYYWEYRHETWQWKHTSQFYPVDSFTVDAPKNGAAKVSIPVKWGGYRLEIRQPDTGLVSSYRIWAGWRPKGLDQEGSQTRPDRVALSLDKPGYKPGDMAKLTIKAPQAGTGYVFVESDTNLLTMPVEIPATGKTITFEVDPSWLRHDLYVSALIIRKGESHTDLPKRSVGLIHLPLDRTQRQLTLKTDLPEKIEPNQIIDVSVDVRRPDGSAAKEAFVTLAAVDVGILNLSGFKTPSPHSYFFQDRRYDIQMHDIYQNLIEANKGEWARQRFGGDAAALSRGGDKPATDVQIISISKNAVPTNADGRASFKLPIPEFNGSVRIMAIAHTGHTYGSFEQEMTVAAPLVTQITMPRFLSMGDKSQLVIDVHNLTDLTQSLDVNLEIKGPVRAMGETLRRVSLAPDEKSALIFDVFAQQRFDRSQINLSVDGLVLDGEKKAFQRSWFLDTRPAYPAETKMFKTHLTPGQTFEIKAAQMGHLLKETVVIQAVLNTVPTIHLSEHIAQLNAYPYGCLEQTTSGIFPHVILSSSDISALGIEGQSSATVEKKLNLGIQRLMEKQKTTGGFGLWSAKGRESYWLTAYVTDFLLHARQAGYPVPKRALAKALGRLKTYIKRPATVRAANYMNKKHYKAAARAYAAFVLARVQGIGLGDARALYQSEKTNIKSSLGMVQMGLCLSLSGDTALGSKVLKEAMLFCRQHPRKNRIYYGDYGSDIRDLAAAYFLIASFYPEFDGTPQFLLDLEDKLASRQWLSTQERNALVLAGSVTMKNRGKAWTARINSGSRTQDLDSDRQKQIIRRNADAANGFIVTNTGTTDLFISAAMAGYPEQQPASEARGIKISRRYLSPGGTPLEKGSVTSGDRMIVELSFTADKRIPNGLIVDLLPACLELEDPNLAGSMVIDNISVDKKNIRQWHRQLVFQHTEYRDDRFVAAVNIPGKKRYRIFYPVRVVSPGAYLIPPPLAEDMYRPYIRGIGDTEPLMQVIQP